MRTPSQDPSCRALTNNTAQKMEGCILDVLDGLEVSVMLLNVLMTNQIFQILSPAPNRCSCTHGDCGPPHWWNRDHCSLAELDCGLPTAQTGGTTMSYKTKQAGTLNLLPSPLSSLISTSRFRPGCTRRCARCWGNATPSTVTDTDFPFCAL